MLIEVRGTDFRNKGAELMLHAIVQHFKHDNDIEITTVFTSGTYVERAELGLYQKLWIYRLGNNLNHLINMALPKKMMKKFGVYKNGEIDVLLDGSGFSYSDQCGIRNTEKAGNHFEYQKKKGKKIILLPQAFGPFENEVSKNGMIKIIKNTDLIFTRDKKSYDYILSCVDKNTDVSHIRISPDFTNLVSGQSDNGYEKLINRVCIVPNYRMIDKTKDKDGSAYKLFLKNTIEILREKSIPFFLLVHDTGKDKDLVKELDQHFNNELTIVDEMNPLVIKGLIGNSKFTIGSRFHGLVSGLSQSVPSLATGWSHKYQMLFEDYDSTEWIIKDLKNRNDLEKKISQLNDESYLETKRNHLNEKGLMQKQKTREMWKLVDKVIKGK